MKRVCCSPNNQKTVSTLSTYGAPWLGVNNRERFVQSGLVSEAAGAKITVTRDPVITDNRFENNLATGLWLDINVSDATVTRNIVEGNLRHCIYYEISANAIIASNIVVDNGVSGIALADASGVKVYNNTLVGNSVAFQRAGRLARQRRQGRDRARQLLGFRGQLRNPVDCDHRFRLIATT